MLHIQHETLSRVLKKLKRNTLIDSDKSNKLSKTTNYLFLFLLIINIINFLI